MSACVHVCVGVCVCMCVCVRSHFGSSLQDAQPPCTHLPELCSMVKSKRSSGVFGKTVDAATVPPAERLREEGSSAMEDMERVVDRNIVRFFGGLVPAAAIDVVEVDGKTMRQRMLLDRAELLQSGRKRADPAYFGALKKSYLSALTGKPLVSVADESEIVPEGLLTSMCLAKASQRRLRKREPVVHWLWSWSQPFNQKTVLALVDLMVETQQSGCFKQSCLVVEIFGAVDRLNKLGTMTNELQPAMPILEESLRVMYGVEKSKDTEYTYGIFWQRYKHVASLFLDPVMMDTVIASATKLTTVIRCLCHLATMSKLGHDMFMHFCPEVVSHHVNEFMQSTANELLNFRGKLTSKIVSGVVGKMLAEADRLNMDKVIIGARTVGVNFMGHVLQIKVHSSVELARLHTAAAIKTCALRYGFLCPLQIEEEVCPLTVTINEDFHMQIEELVLKMYREARRMVDALMRKTTFASAKAVSEFMELKRPLWTTLDPTFELEVAYVRALAGPIGGQLLLAQAVACLPEEGRCSKYGPVLEKLRQLEATRAWLFSTPQSRGVVKALMDRVAGMERGDGPLATEFPKATVMETAGDRLAHFCCAEQVLDTGEIIMLTGRSAAASRLALLGIAVDNGTLKDLQPVTDVMVFKWLLTSQDAAKLDTLAQVAYNLVLNRSTTKADVTASGAMEVMVAAHTSAKVGAAIKKRMRGPPAGPTKRAKC